MLLVYLFAQNASSIGFTLVHHFDIGKEQEVPSYGSTSSWEPPIHVSEKQQKNTNKVHKSIKKHFFL